MCQQLMQFCSGSTKPLLFAGSFLLLLLAIAIGYIGCTANALYQDIDLTVAQERSLAYYLQLAAAVYLALITVLASVAAHYDQKHSIRALSVVTSINFVVAAAATIMVPAGPMVGKLFEDKLQKAAGMYNFKDRYPVLPVNASSNSTSSLASLASLIDGKVTAAISRQSRWTSAEQAPDGAADASAAALAPGGGIKVAPLNESEATRIWDTLQARGCCGFLNATTEWKPDRIPKSCCANPEESQEIVTCKKVDADHGRPCIEIIGAGSLNLFIVLALIALVNLYLATVTGVSAYRTFHYNEASQNAYGP